MSTTLAGTLAVLLFAFPLAGALGNALLGPRLGRRFCNIVGPGVVLAGFVCAVVALVALLGAHEDARSTTVTLWSWLDLGLHGLKVNVDIKKTVTVHNGAKRVKTTSIVHVHTTGHGSFHLSGLPAGAAKISVTRVQAGVTMARSRGARLKVNKTQTLRLRLKPVHAH